jgi:hypothetical protein
MNQPHIKNEKLNVALKAVDKTLKASGQVMPTPGFSARWKQRLEMDRIQVARQQARMLLSVNLSLSVILFMLIGTQTLRMVDSLAGLVLRIVDWFSQGLIFFQMVFGVWGSLSKTIVGVVPGSWWGSLALSFLGLLLWWGASLRRHTTQERTS